MHLKDFDKWNSKKKNLNTKEVNRNLFYSEREVWWCSLGVNIGVEVDGKNADFERPFLIIKVFNSEQIWGVPLTSKEKISSHYVPVIHEKGVSYANISQIKTISTKRLLRKIGMVNEISFKQVIAKIKECI